MELSQPLARAKRLTDRAAMVGGQVVSDRNDALRAARSAGHSLREIAAATGLSHQTIKRLTQEGTKKS